MSTPTELAKAAFGTEKTTYSGMLQEKLAAWQGRNFGAATVEQMALGVSEEAGELSHAVLKHIQKIRGMEDMDAFREAAGDAIADCTIYLMQIATILRLDYLTLVQETARKVMERDWKARPNDAHVVSSEP